MKTKTLIILAGLILIFTGCKDKVYNKYLANSPVYMSYDEFRKSIKFESPKSITTKGNIYVKDNYLFVNTPYEGIHIIDNSNPSAPKNLGFLNIMGNTNLAIKGNYLMVNAYIDLVVFDISNITEPTEISRVENAFPTSLPTYDYNKNYPIANIDKSKGIVVGFEIKEVKEETKDNPFNNCFECYYFSTSDFNESIGAGSSNQTSNSNNGISGSITKMTLIDDNLYVVDNNVLYTLNSSNINQITINEGVRLIRQVETLFSNNSNIFMGTTTGLVIYGTTNPQSPNLISVINHVDACDPVVVKDNFAYVTIRSGTICGGEVNELEVIDVSNLSNPILKESFNMSNPHGLGIDNNQLFICDGTSGLKIFDATNPLDCGNQMIKKYDGIQATDIILNNGIAILIGDNGIYQYDYSDVNNINELSVINF